MMNRSPRVLMAVLFAVLCATGVPVVSAASQVNEELARAYLEKWGGRESEATTPDLRRRLAADLLEAARKPYVPREMVVQMCLRAYHFGTQDAFSTSSRAGYSTAAKALEHMKNTDPSMTLTALERVSGLYKSAYESNPGNYLGLGLSYANASMQVADRRLVDLEHAVARGEMTLTQMSAQVNLINREYLAAYKTADSILKRAQRLAVTYKRQGKDNVFNDLTAFVEENEPLLDQLQAAAADTEPLANRLKEVKIDIGRHERSPTRATAERICAFYLFEMDSPALAMPYAGAYMKSEDLRFVELAASGSSSLDAPQALNLAEWYLALTGESGNDEHVNTMLLRARRYFALCSGKFDSDDKQFARAAEGMEQVNVMLEERGIERKELAVKPKDEPKAETPKETPAEQPKEQPEEGPAIVIENPEVDAADEEEAEAIIEQIEEEDADSRFKRRDERFENVPKRGNIFDF